MINFNGTIENLDAVLSTNNRSFLYGDGVFETLKIRNGRIIFWEDHYFRLMASMRIVRMKIPQTFTMEFLENLILELCQKQDVLDSARVRFTVFRNDGGYYKPASSAVSFIIQANAIVAQYLPEKKYEVELYKDFYVAKNLLSTIKTTSKMTHVTGSIFAEENDFENCILLNTDKNIIEFLNGNLFMVKDNQIITPPISEGCLNGIIRKKILEMKNLDGILECNEAIISPFDLQKAEEVFLTNSIIGVQAISKYRKKEYSNVISNQVSVRLKELITEKD